MDIAISYFVFCICTSHICISKLWYAESKDQTETESLRKHLVNYFYVTTSFWCGNKQKMYGLLTILSAVHTWGFLATSSQQRCRDLCSEWSPARHIRVSHRMSMSSCPDRSSLQNQSQPGIKEDVDVKKWKKSDLWIDKLYASSPDMLPTSRKPAKTDRTRLWFLAAEYDHTALSVIFPIHEFD